MNRRSLIAYLMAAPFLTTPPAKLGVSAAAASTPSWSVVLSAHGNIIGIWIHDDGSFEMRDI